MKSAAILAFLALSSVPASADSTITINKSNGTTVITTPRGTYTSRTEQTGNTTRIETTFQSSAPDRRSFNQRALTH